MRILFIPHTPSTDIINRVYEFANISGGYILDWKIENSSFARKVHSQLYSMLRKTKLEDRVLSAPLLFRPDAIAPKINTKILNHTIEKYDIDIVVNANALLFDISSIKVPVIYDLVDDHLAVNPYLGLSKKRVEKIKEDLKNASAVVTVTDLLKKKVEPLNSDVVTIENGVYIEKFERAVSIKKELGLEGKKVFGYIGGVDSWTGLHEACEAYEKIKSSDNAMIIVGGNNSKYYNDLKEKYSEYVLFTGPISPEKVGNFFKSIDIGLIPFILNDFTHNALPIKALEYGLAGAQVLSTPLNTLLKKRYPFIHFYSIDKFVLGMKQVEPKKVKFDFSSLSWQKQTEKLLAFIEEVT